MERCNFWKKYFRWFAVSTCPPGQVLAGPDMSDYRLFVEFRMFWVQSLFFGLKTMFFELLHAKPYRII